MKHQYVRQQLFFSPLSMLSDRLASILFITKKRACYDISGSLFQVKMFKKTANGPVLAEISVLIKKKKEYF